MGACVRSAGVVLSGTVKRGQASVVRGAEYSVP